MSDVTSREHREVAGRLREVMATYANARDLINIGAYARGSSPQIDEAIARIEPCRRSCGKARRKWMTSRPPWPA